MVMMSKTFHNLSFLGQNLHSCLASIWETSCLRVSSQLYFNGVVSYNSHQVIGLDRIMARLFVVFVLSEWCYHQMKTSQTKRLHQYYLFLRFLQEAFYFLITIFLVSFFLWLPFGVSWVRSFSTLVIQEKPHFYQCGNFHDGILAKRELLNPANDIYSKEV